MVNFLIKLQKYVTGSVMFSYLYRGRFYINLGIAQVNWFTGKLPEIMAFVFLLEWFGFSITQGGLLWLGVGVMGGLLIGGYIWKNAGLYDVECYVNADKHPVSHEMLKAARKINSCEIVVVKNDK